MLKILPMEQLRKLSVDQQDELIRQASAIENKAIVATEAHKLSFPAAGKLVCIAEERLNELKSTVNPDGSARKPLIAVNTSLATYWGSLTKGKDGKPGKLNNHWLSCAVAFGTYVRTELVTEADYDKNTAQCLELSSSISTEVGGDVSHEAIIEAADVLKDRPKDAAKQLRSILEGLKGPKAITSDKAKEMLVAIFASGHLATLVIPMIGAEIAHIEDSETARSAYHAMQCAGAMFEQNVDATGARRFSDEVIDGWIKGKEEANQPPKMENGADAPPAPGQPETQPDAKPKGKGKKSATPAPESQPEPQQQAA